ncbi:MAG: M20/M25/M40 family metallo-hydrolase [Thermoleophilia bacterium]|nr:M20/M25/M40 family metallo-hydrolase [Thermoleophilia bacterium]MDH3724129.1 M20/M25/M40 family metallo-hydrolase [Thermoleophilia bacterium]
MNRDLLKRLCAASGAPGKESDVIQLVRDELEPVADEFVTDPLGGAVARLAGDGPRLLLAAHADEIGFIVSHIEEGGFLRVLTLGGFDPKTLTAQRVLVHGRDDLLGVMGAKPVHLMTDEEKRRPAKVEDFYVDLGLPEERVRELVRPGDRVTRERSLDDIGDLVSGKSLDNRAGLYVMIEAVKRLGEHACDIHAAATVQEEVGMRGARVAASRVRPHLGLAIDITLANDGPDAKPHQRVTSVGDGAAIKVFDRSAIVPTAVVDHLVALAEERGIPYQLEVMPRGGTDTRELQLAGDGAIAGAVSIPARYVHQVVEACHPDDLDACVDLVVAFCETAQVLVQDG